MIIALKLLFGERGIHTFGNAYTECIHTMMGVCDHACSLYAYIYDSVSESRRRGDGMYVLTVVRLC